MLSFLRSLEPVERRNAIFYIAGIMCYKFGLDAIMTSFDSLIRHHATRLESSHIAWISALIANYVLQCFGSLLVTPLIRKFRIQHVLAFSVLGFGLITGIFPVIALIGGHKYVRNGKDIENFAQEYMWLAIVLYGLTGFFQGLVELVRRVIPQMIIGNESDRLKRLDSIVHIFYELSGTVGPLVVFFGLKANDASAIYYMLPFLFLSPLSFVCWLTIRLKKPISIDSQAPDSRCSFFREVYSVFQSFCVSVAQGATLVCRNRSLVWLIPAYSLPLVLHRYLEGVFLSQYAEIKHNDRDLRLAFLSSSNFGELLGAAFTLVFVHLVKTPLPWLRLDAITLLLSWEFYSVSEAFKGTPTFLPVVIGMCAMCTAVSFGWASGDVSLVAYIQSTLGELETKTSRASPLGSVMAFLYVCYVAIFASISIPINIHADSLERQAKNSAVTEADQKAAVTAAKRIIGDKIIFVSCIAFSVCAVIILAATFVPKNSFALNPKSLQSDVQKDPAIKPEEEIESPDAPLK